MLPGLQQNPRSQAYFFFFFPFRLELNHTSNTAFEPDKYNQEHKSHRMPDGWLKYIQGHACYDPVKVGDPLAQVHPRACML